MILLATDKTLDHVQPSLKNKGMITSYEIALKQDIINDEIKAAEILDLTKKKPVSVLDSIMLIFQQQFILF